MTDIMSAAKKRAEKFDIRNVLVATSSGASIKKAHEVFGTRYDFFVVGNPASAHERGLVHHARISQETRQDLEKMGIKVVLQDQSLFQEGHGGSFIGASSLQEVASNTGSDCWFNAISIVYNVLQLFSDGSRVCLEIAP